jgi:hypothetical protein
VKEQELHWVPSSTLASIEVTEFQAADAYSNESNFKYIIKRLYREEKERLYSKLNHRNYDDECNYARNNNNNNNNNK